VRAAGIAITRENGPYRSLLAATNAAARSWAFAGKFDDAMMAN